MNPAQWIERHLARIPQHLRRPLIQTLAVRLGHPRRMGMNLGRHPQHQVAGMWWRNSRRLKKKAASQTMDLIGLDTHILIAHKRAKTADKNQTLPKIQTHD